MTGTGVNILNSIPMPGQGAARSNGSAVNRDSSSPQNDAMRSSSDDFNSVYNRLNESQNGSNGTQNSRNDAEYAQNDANRPQNDRSDTDTGHSRQERAENSRETDRNGLNGRDRAQNGRDGVQNDGQAGQNERGEARNGSQTGENSPGAGQNGGKEGEKGSKSDSDEGKGAIAVHFFAQQFLANATAAGKTAGGATNKGEGVGKVGEGSLRAGLMGSQKHLKIAESIVKNAVNGSKTGIAGAGGEGQAGKAGMAGLTAAIKNASPQVQAAMEEAVKRAGKYEGQNGGKNGQNGAEMVNGDAKMGPNGGIVSQMGQNGAKMAGEGAKMVQNGTKMASATANGSQNGPGEAKTGTALDPAGAADKQTENLANQTGKSTSFKLNADASGLEVKQADPTLKIDRPRIKEYMVDNGRAVEASQQAAAQVGSAARSISAGQNQPAMQLNASQLASPNASPAGQTAQAMAMALQNGQDSVSLTLNPAELGRVNIRFAQDNGEITGFIQAERLSTRDEIAHGVAEVVKSLQQQGLAVKKVEVVLTEQSTQDSTNADASQDFAAFGQGGEGSDGGSDTSGDSPSNTENSTQTETQGNSAGRQVETDGSLDKLNLYI